MVVLITPQDAIVRISVAKMIGMITTPWPWCRLKNDVAYVIVNMPPSMKTSPWAKLISSRMPYTSV